ncbi:uncharacterized protein LOC122254981 isoform X2 [Penaeus japonicus]|uniref:uncharacterized protein LOC122254981 isoform X2 n=1 Tax=Penaeus japonicus TaxID=27405 RepID=UPI001C717153|nr:uncharacterized protein LOC122254981 isoform X2 [Penaeus japonicus]
MEGLCNLHCTCHRNNPPCYQCVLLECTFASPAGVKILQPSAPVLDEDLDSPLSGHLGEIQSVNSTALSPPSEAFAPRLVGEVTVGTGGDAPGRRHARHHTRNETGKGERKGQPLATARHFSPLPRDDLLSHPKLEASVKPKVLHPLRRCVISPSHPLPKPRPLNFPPRTRDMNWPDDAPRKSSSRNSQRAANFRNNRSAAYELRWNSLVTSMSSSRAPPFTPERHERRCK